MNNVWLNGKIIEEKNLNFSINSSCLYYSHSIFDGCKIFVDQGVVYSLNLKRHIERFLESCIGFGFKSTYTYLDLYNAVSELILSNSPKSTCGLRLFALNDTDVFLNEKPSIVIFLRSLENYPLKKSVKLYLSDKIRHTHALMPAWIKSSAHYSSSRIELNRAKSQGCDDVLFLNEHKRITETTRATVLLMKNHFIYYPPKSEGVLPGITKLTLRKISEIFGKEQWIWREEPIEFDSLNSFDGAFICSSTIGLIRVDQINTNIFSNVLFDKFKADATLPSDGMALLDTAFYDSFKTI